MPAPYRFGWVDRSGANWGSTAFTTVTQFAPLIRESVTLNYAKVHGQAPTQVSRHRPNQGSLTVRGSLIFALDPTYTVPLLEYGMGARRAGPPAYYDMADTLPTFGFELDKGVQRWRFRDTIVNRLILRCRVDEEPELELDVVAWYDSRVATAFPTLTSSGQARYDFQNMRVMVADKADAMSTSTDEVDVRSVELTVDNRLDLVHGSGAQQAVLPERDGFREAMLAMELTRYDTTQWATWKDDQEDLQAEIQFQKGADITTFAVSTAEIDEGADAPVEGPATIKDRVTLGIYAGANTFLTGNNFTDDMLSVLEV